MSYVAHDLFSGYESPLERAKRKSRSLQSVDALTGITERVPYNGSPGWKARETSRQAAERVPASILRAKVLAEFERPGCWWTADEVAERLNLSVLSVRPRVTELSNLGKIYDSGERRPNASGRNAIVWRLAA